MVLCLVVPDSTPLRFVNSQLVSLSPVAFSKLLSNLQVLFAYFSVHNKLSSAKHLDTLARASADFRSVLSAIH